VLRLVLVQRHPRRLNITGNLLPVDLPVDAAVVLEQQEGADQPGGGERTLRECRCPS
jgi:hypothetical protein